MEEPEIPGYRIVRRLGHGGMGEVFLAEDEWLGRQVAVKRMSEALAADPVARERFLREAHTMALQSHPGLVQIHELKTHGGRDFLVLELAEGGTLADRLRELGALPVREALEILRQAATGLAAAWKLGIVHRDVKPMNIFFDRHGYAKVGDFGLARPARGTRDPRLTSQGIALGSPLYMSPEHAGEGEMSSASDIYSLGVVLYEMLVGQPPGLGDSDLAILGRHFAGTLPDLAVARPDLQTEVPLLYRWMTRRNPAERPASYERLLDAIDRLLAGHDAGIQPAPRADADRRRGRAWQLGLAAGAVVLVVAGAVVLVRRSGGTEPAPVLPAGAESTPMEPSVASPVLSAVEPPAAIPRLVEASPAEPVPGSPGATLVVSLGSLRTGVFSLRLEALPGSGEHLRASADRPARFVVLAATEAGDLVRLYPPGLEAGDEWPAERSLILSWAGAGEIAWVVLLATGSPLTQPLVLGARPEAERTVYPGRVEAREPIFPACEYAGWLSTSLRQLGGERDAAVLPVAAPRRAAAPSQTERRTPL